MIAAGELVYVVPRAELFPEGLFPEGAPQGFFPDGIALLDRIYECGHFADRARVEEDPSLKQIIPYAVVVRDDTPTSDIFRFRRRGGGEKRLVGLSSVGVGGHVNPEDAADIIQHCLRRELTEELFLPDAWDSELLGLLNDDSTAVGSVHLGVVCRVTVGAGEVRVREEDAMEGAFVTRDALLDEHRRDRTAFETWSAFLLDRPDEVLAPANMRADA
ncbi:MAG: phosphoesterase [Planctomycetota bacterium]|jgi:predicted NUDIX family phosphoesterase